ncbi:prefoldin chaperone subunit family protein isoform X1 [Wolffia australiana]
MEDYARGSVTPLSSIYPAEEAHKAAKRVQNAIVDRQKELQRLSQFSSENKNLINLAQSLPDELSHEIMVPFGKAAFFPGRLIHTNEFVVFLGEGYYVERSAKQTVEILQRRGKTLDSQIASLKATLADLDAEAKFFSSTAVEAEEGLVEIREDYVEEIRAERKPESGKSQIPDEEFSRIMSILDELEEEEKAAEDSSTHESTGKDQSFSFPDAFDDLSVRDSTEAPLLGQATENLPSYELASTGKGGDNHESIQLGMKALSTDEQTLPKATRGFTGSVIERRHAPLPSASSEAPSTNSTKPISRFKMRRAQS